MNDLLPCSVNSPKSVLEPARRHTRPSYTISKALDREKIYRPQNRTQSRQNREYSFFIIKTILTTDDVLAKLSRRICRNGFGDRGYAAPPAAGICSLLESLLTATTSSAIQQQQHRNEADCHPRTPR
ncbi:hypothetical protein Mapa_007162 [Marchantia paleacea]|nr:hypothetical protein Mapa_007162 [Marchantia paleacea]